MDKTQVKELIVEYVTEVEGCKATDLITDLPIRQIDHETLIALGEHDLSILVTELVQEKKLIEIGYQLPLEVHWVSSTPEEMTHRMKKQERSYLVPANCEIVIKGVQKN